MAIQIEAVNLTTQSIQNVSGTSSNIGFFFTGTWAQHPESGLLNVRPGWTVVGNPTWVVTMVDEGSQTITISSGIFISGQAYQFMGSGGISMTGGFIFSNT